MWPFDQNNQQVYQQYANAYDTGNYYGFDQNQVLNHLHQFFTGAPANMQQQLYQQHFAQMPFEQRMLLAQQMPPQYYMDPNDPYSMAQSFTRLGQEQPHILRQVLSHPMLAAMGLGLAGLVAKHMLSHHHEYRGGGYNQGYNQGYGQEQYLEQQLYQEREREKELRRELRQEERREERLEEREHHHHHQRDFF